MERRFLFVVTRCSVLWLFKGGSRNSRKRGAWKLRRERTAPPPPRIFHILIRVRYSIIILVYITYQGEMDLKYEKLRNSIYHLSKVKPLVAHCTTWKSVGYRSSLKTKETGGATLSPPPPPALFNPCTELQPLNWRSLNNALVLYYCQV